MMMFGSPGQTLISTDYLKRTIIWDIHHPPSVNYM